MDGNCNIITEILLVISYTTSYCKKKCFTVTKLLVTSYCPTLPRGNIRGVTVHKIHGSVRYDTVVSRFSSVRSVRG